MTWSAYGHEVQPSGVVPLDPFGLRERGDYQAKMGGFVYDHLDRPSKRFDVEMPGDRRKTFLETGKRTSQVAHGKVRINDDRQLGFQASYHPSRLHLEGACFMEHAPCPGKQHPSLVAQLRPVSRPVEQRKAQIGFQFFNGIGDGRLRPSERAGGSGEATLLDHSQKTRSLIHS